MSKIVTALAHNKHIRMMAIDSTSLVRDAVKAHQLAPTSSAALGRVLSIASLMAAQLKNENEMLSINILGSGVIRQIRVDACQNGNIVGFVDRKDVMLINETTHKLDVGAAIGSGTLTVARSLGLKDEYQSTIDLVTAEIGDDFALYFAQSEQLPSAVSVGVLVNPQGEVVAAGGLLIQMMPGHDETDVNTAQHVVDHLKPISQIFAEGMQVDELVLALFEDAEIVNEQTAQFKCHYDRQALKDVLLTLSKEDLVELIEAGDGVDLECHYCSSVTHFSNAELEMMLVENGYVKN